MAAEPAMVVVAAFEAPDQRIANVSALGASWHNVVPCRCTGYMCYGYAVGLNMLIES